MKNGGLRILYPQENIRMATYTVCLLETSEGEPSQQHAGAGFATVVECDANVIAIHDFIKCCAVHALDL